MAYNPELIKQLLGEKVSELFDGTIEIEPSKNEIFGNLKVGDKLTFKFKNTNNKLPEAGKLQGNIDSLSLMDRLRIAVQADGNIRTWKLFFNLLGSNFYGCWVMGKIRKYFRAVYFP